MSFRVPYSNQRAGCQLLCMDFISVYWGEGRGREVSGGGGVSGGRGKGGVVNSLNKLHINWYVQVLHLWVWFLPSFWYFSPVRRHISISHASGVNLEAFHSP